jgi:hypothetical protein
LTQTEPVAGSVALCATCATIVVIDGDDDCWKLRKATDDDVRGLNPRDRLDLYAMRRMLILRIYKSGGAGVPS